MPRHGCDTCLQEIAYPPAAQAQVDSSAFELQSLLPWRFALQHALHSPASCDRRARLGQDRSGIRPISAKPGANHAHVRGRSCARYRPPCTKAAPNPPSSSRVAAHRRPHYTRRSPHKFLRAPPRS